MTGDGDSRRPPRLVFLTTLAERQLRRWVDARGRQHGITAAGAGVLFHLAGNPNATVGSITASLNASPAGCSALLSRMEAAGMITRTVDEADRRSIRVALSPEGRGALAEVRAALAELNATITAGFEPEELAIVERWLHHVSRLR